jgi:2-polyprenyl-3-methyl-5-hydroxy-6-metoxy-1,4-benzoquinol methylase
MVYANPVPGEYASGQYYDQAGRDYYLSPAKLESDYAEVRFKRELRLFRTHCQGGAVLDVGCSSGAFLYQLNRLFPGVYRVLGTDASGPPLDYAESRGVPVVRGDFTKHEFGDARFDAICFWAVLEHLIEPKVFLERAWALLKPDGWCFVLVPNLKSLAARLLGARYRYIYPQHLNYFTRSTVTRLVESKFSVVTQRCTHFNPLVIMQDWRSGGAEVSNRERADLLKRTTSYKQSAWLKPLRLAYTTAEFALGAVGLADNLALVLRKKN